MSSSTGSTERPGPAGPQAEPPAPGGRPLRLSVVVPCFNEDASLTRLHTAVTTAVTALDDVEVEYVYVDDGSTDGTLAELRRLAAADPAVRYLALSRNFGKESAMLAGLDRASGDAVIVMDADLQHPPRLLPDMVALYRQGYDQVIACRDRRGDRFVRTVASRTFYRLMNRWVDVQLLDGAGDFRLLSRRAVDALRAMPEYNRFSKGLYSWIGFNTVVFAYPNEARAGGGSRWSFRSLLNYAFDGLLSFNDRPLRSAIYAGMGLTFIAVAYAAWVVAAALIRGIDAPGYTTIIVSVIGLGGIQMMILGVIGEYIGRIYYETKRRPRYLVMESDGAGGTPQVPTPRRETTIPGPAADAE
ncbi:glycosyltransferase family 2 protein [Solwaraspora sp. WMMD937]|nr:glycosyltransferase family 2 protein [Solwaraspora sp. WMMD937]WFE20465.1 glycosyltransferase family 2 protein [Solwaraspora sp. WMMD937]